MFVCCPFLFVLLFRLLLMPVMLRSFLSILLWLFYWFSFSCFLCCCSHSFSDVFCVSAFFNGFCHIDWVRWLSEQSFSRIKLHTKSASLTWRLCLIYDKSVASRLHERRNLHKEETQNKLTYIGNTWQKLENREHRVPLKKNQHYKLYIKQYIVFFIKLLEDYPLQEKEYLLGKEGGKFREHQSELNTIISGRTNK